MLSIYTGLKCKHCSKEIILITEQLLSVDADRYLVCPYCSSRDISVRSSTDNLKECMKERSYRRINGALKSANR